MRAIILLILACCVFGSAGYFTWLLFVKPGQDLQLERSLPPPTPPPDPTVPEYNKRVTLHTEGKLIEARKALQEFIDRYPESTKLDEAKNRLGEINATIFLSPIEVPEKQSYIVKSGDVLSRVATKVKSTPEFLMKANNLQQVMLRIGQKITYAPHDFTVLIDRKAQKVILLNEGRFFAQYAILAVPEKKKGQAAAPVGRQVGTVTDKIAWHDGGRVSYADKTYNSADHWVVVSAAGNTLYSFREAGSDGKKPKRPPSGIGLAPEDMQKLALLVRKGTPVIIE